MYGTGSSCLDYTGALQYVDGDDFNLDDSIVTYDVKLITSAGCTKMLSQTKDLVSCCAAISTDATDLMSTNSLGGVHAFCIYFPRRRYSRPQAAVHFRRTTRQPGRDKCFTTLGMFSYHTTSPYRPRRRRGGHRMRVMLFVPCVSR